MFASRSQYALLCGLLSLNILTPALLMGQETTAAPAAVPKADAPAPVAGKAEEAPAAAAKPEATPTRPAMRWNIVNDAAGSKFQVNGRDFLIKGVNWGYSPSGENYSYDFWSKPDAFIENVLETEMSMLKSMGVNTIRQFSMIPPRWVTYIYEKYGIYTAVNHLFGRYGFSVNGVWIPNVDYSDPKTRDAIKKDVLATVETYKNTPGVLLWMLGNENNYGLSWSSSEIENLPVGERDGHRATYLYTLYGEVATAVKELDRSHPLTIVNGDLQYIELIAKHAAAIDMLGTNVYRGPSARDLYAKVKSVLGKPVFFTEFGSDAFNAKTGREDGLAQAEMLKSQWAELYDNTYGQGKAGNAVGGIVFEWTDEWWKYKQTENLSVHDETASWSNEGYAFDYVKGANNMNEEWFGIVGKTATNAQGQHKLSPRPAYYVLKQILANDPYDPSKKPGTIAQRIASLDVRDYEGMSAGIRANNRLDDLERFYLKGARLRLETIGSSGNNNNAETRKGWKANDHLESLTLNFGWKPTSTLNASAAINILGNVPQNKMDQIFYENRGAPYTIRNADGTSRVVNDNERIKLHSASFDWNEEDFQLEGFYRIAHGHWADEGDYFGLYQETYDLAGIDRYNSDAPNGMMFTGKKWLSGLKIVAGPQVYWGARPMAIVKYSGQAAGFTYGLMHQQAFAAQEEVATSSLTDPGGRAGKSSLYLSRPVAGVKVEWGLLHSGSEKIGDHYTKAEKTDGGKGYLGSDYRIINNAKVTETDAFATKFRLVGNSFGLPWYVAGAYRGLVANGANDAAIVVTKWSLKPSERGNQYNVAGGTQIGLANNFSVAPQLLYQKPLLGALPPDPRVGADQFDPATGTFTQGIRPRNILNDTFAVLDNQEMLGAELLFLYDPTPGDWFFDWNNGDRESAPTAASLDIVYRKLYKSRDASLGVLANGQVFVFAGPPPVTDLWDVVLRTVHVQGSNLRVINQIYGGTGIANGSDQRIIKRYGVGSTLRYGRTQTQAQLKWNDWGPYDYHRDYNLTFPLQAMISFGYGLEPFRLDRDVSQIGVRYQMRKIDPGGERFPVTPTAGKRANEEEWMTYAELSI